MDVDVEATTADVPQSEPLSEEQVRNNAGGFVYSIDDFACMKRFVILGSDGNNYYVSQSDVEIQNAECVVRLLASGQGPRVVEEVTRISKEGRAPRQSPGILVLAMCARLGDAPTRRAALAALPAVCRTASTLFEFVQRCKELGELARRRATTATAATTATTATTDAAAAAAPDKSTTDAATSASATATATADASVTDAPPAATAAAPAADADTAAALDPATFRAWVAEGKPAGKPSWGRSMRRAIALWYLSKSPAAVAYQVTKYSQRNGWSHADLLRLAHPDPEEHAAKRRKVAAESAAVGGAGGAASGVVANVAAGEGPAAVAAAADAKQPAAATAGGGGEEEKEDEEEEWVVVPQSVMEGGEEGDAAEGGVASEQGALAAAATAAAQAAAAAAAKGDDDDAAAAAAQALQVADMKAIFDFLTHGTLPGQERPARRGKRPAAAEAVRAAAATAMEDGSKEGVSEPAAASAGPSSADPAPMDASASTAAAISHASAADASAAAPAETGAVGTPTADTAADVVMEPATTPPSSDPTADIPTCPAAETAATDAPASTATAIAFGPTSASSPSTSSPPPLGPVMQYLLDAHRLRKQIRAPPPLAPKTQPPPEDDGEAATTAARKRLHALDIEDSPPSAPAAEPTATASAAAASSDAANKTSTEASQARQDDGEETAVQTAPPPRQQQQEQPPSTAARPDPDDPVAKAAHAAAHAAAVSEAVGLIRRHRFGHEHVGDTTLLRSPDIWSAFLGVGMPLTALIRNLGRMTQLGVMERRDCLAAVTTRLTDSRVIAAARVHPMSILDAMCTYRDGRGARGVARWTPVAAVSKALQAAFYLAFKNVEPTGRKYLVGLDVSGSMGCANCSGMKSVNCREAAAAMLMALVRSEPSVETVAFSHELVPMAVNRKDRLQDVVDRAQAIPMGGTDCAAPIMYAQRASLPVDVFVILTDNETWFGSVHPAAALRSYRDSMGRPDAKLVVLAFSATKFSIADPKDPGMLDVAGLDSAVPRLVADFVCGRL